MEASNVDYLPDFFPKIPKTFTKMKFLNIFFRDFGPSSDSKFGPNILKIWQAFLFYYLPDSLLTVVGFFCLNDTNII